jgi:hypothetical protein
MKKLQELLGDRPGDEAEIMKNYVFFVFHSAAQLHNTQIFSSKRRVTDRAVTPMVPQQIACIIHSPGLCTAREKRRK